MSDDIIVSGGGSVVITTDAILARIERLGSLANELHSHSSQVLEIVAANRMAAAQQPRLQPTLSAARPSMDQAYALLLSASRRSAALSRALREVLEACGSAEDFARRLAERMSADAAWWLGRVSAVVAVPVAATLWLDELVVQGISGATPQQQAEVLGQYLLDHGGILANPVTVSAIRAGVENVAPFSEGVVGLPPEVAELVSRLTGVGGLAMSAAFLAQLGHAVGFLRETDVSVRRMSAISTVSPPDSLVSRVDRIPDPLQRDDGEQIRIDRYSTPGQPDRFDVYVGGTVDFGARSASEPFDMTSNITGVAQQSPASYRAVLEAMKQAGVTEHSPVQLTGYSQGGLVASLVAASGKYDVKGLFTLGSPSGQVTIPATIPVLTVRHTEDLVPATGGYDVNDRAVVVQRSLFDDQSVPNGIAVPAHHLEYYRDTAGLIDSAKSEELTTITRRLDDFGAGASTVESTMWLARRTPSG